MKRQLITLLFACTAITWVRSQSVGVGTTTPDASAVLDVTSVTQGMLVPRMTTAQRELIAAPAAGLLVFDVTTGTFWFRGASAWTELVAGGESEVIRNGPDMIYMGLTDSVGIGTMTPGRKLEVRTGNADYGISHINDSVEVATYVANQDGGWIGTVSQHPFNLYAGDGYGQFTLLPNGYVGINLLEPTNKMDIATNWDRSGTHPTGRPLYVTGEIGEDQNGVEFRHDNGTQGIGFGFATIYAAGSNESQHIGLAAKGPAGFVRMFAGGMERMRINGAGQVMIGTATAATGHLLSVDGKIAAEEVLVDLSVDWPDYVFEETYPLPSLRDVRRFIDRRGHLPGVPSAAEVKENGISLGVMHAVLLEKIEELTLYLLQQHERIESLESKLNQQD